MFKKLIALSLLSLLILAPATLAYEDADVEHMSTGENISPKVDLVKITQAGNIIQKENYLTVNFAQNFNSKYYKEGNYVQFNFDNNVRTREGSIIIPCNSSLIARISCLEEPKWFSRNAKVYLEFTHILLPDGTNIPVALNFAKKKKYIQEGAKETTGKIAAYTLSIGAIGSGIGAAIGVASTKDFKDFTRLENPFLPFNRNAVLFPRKINGKYIMLSRPSDSGHTPFGDILLSHPQPQSYATD